MIDGSILQLFYPLGVAIIILQGHLPKDETHPDFKYFDNRNTFYWEEKKRHDDFQQLLDAKSVRGQNK